MTPDTITLKAGSIYPVRVTGKYVSIVSCAAALSVELDDGGRTVAVAGSQFGSDAGFSKISFIETSGKDNEVSYTVSDTPSPGRATVVQATAATFIGPNSALYTFGASGPKIFPGTDTQGRQRKSILISNSAIDAVGGQATAAVAWAALPGNDLFVIVFPGTTQLIETSDDLEIGAGSKQLTGNADLVVAIMEIFYSKPVQTDQ